MVHTISFNKITHQSKNTQTLRGPELSLVAAVAVPRRAYAPTSNSRNDQIIQKAKTGTISPTPAHWQ